MALTCLNVGSEGLEGSGGSGGLEGLGGLGGGNCKIRRVVPNAPRRLVDKPPKAVVLQDQERKTKMKINIDWNTLLSAVFKAAKCTAENEAFRENPRKERSD